MLSFEDNVIDCTFESQNTCEGEEIGLSQKSQTDIAEKENLPEKENILTETEAVELRGLEARVQKGLRAFWEIGQALRQIREKRLYRQEYNTFEEYCHQRWEISRRTAYQLIDAAIVLENVRNCAQKLPLNEAQVRPLVALPPEKQREAWNQAVSTAPNGKVTAAHVQQVVKEYQQLDGTRTRKNGGRQKQEVENQTSDVLSSTESPSCNITVESHLLPNQNQTRSCWNCQHCSSEALPNKETFYCFQLGILNYLEKNGDTRGASCEFWAHRLTDSEKRQPQNQETFTVTLRLPASVQPLMQDAARASNLALADWVAKVLLVAASKSRTTIDEETLKNLVDEVLLEMHPALLH
ncbi:hypothetical protein NUACC21_47170 [Scytonema sp. NUACC21]